MEERLRRDDSLPAVRKIGTRASGRFLDAAFRTRGLCGAVAGPTSPQLAYGKGEVTVELNFIEGDDSTCNDLVHGTVHVDLPEAARNDSVVVTAAWEPE